MKILDISNGDFYLSTNEIIASEDSYSKIISFKSIDHSTNLGNDYKWIYFRNIKISNLYFFLAICFHKEILKSISFSFTLIPQEMNWNNWNETEELEQKKVFDIWLNDHFGKNRNFDWGKINSYYDEKGGSSGILIEYK